MIRTTLLAGLALLAAPAMATTFFDGFEDETTGGSILNYTGFANWFAFVGSVDLVRSGEFGISCRSGSYCVDLDGSTGTAGNFRSRTFAFAAGDEVDTLFWLSGNQRTDTPDRVLVSFFFPDPVDLLGLQLLRPTGFTAPQDRFDFAGGLGFSALISPTDPFGNWGIRFRAGTPGSFFINLVHWDQPDSIRGGSDNLGVILDDVTVRIVSPAAVIPEPATWALLIAGFGLVGAALRRRRLAAA